MFYNEGYGSGKQFGGNIIELYNKVIWQFTLYGKFQLAYLCDTPLKIPVNAHLPGKEHSLSADDYFISGEKSVTKVRWNFS